MISVFLLALKIFEGQKVAAQLVDSETFFNWRSTRT